jgi:FtsP/CotA-like multicopper oxidase with cupredoxin domain
MHKNRLTLWSAAIALAALWWAPLPATAQSRVVHPDRAKKRVTLQQREAAAERLAKKRAEVAAKTQKGTAKTQPATVRPRVAPKAAAGVARALSLPAPLPLPSATDLMRRADGSMIPNYYGITPNWAFSPPLRKFVDGLPMLAKPLDKGAVVNGLGQYLPIGVPDKTTYPGSDYYEIGLVEYTEQMHSDLPPTRLRGYVQLQTPVTASSGLGVTLRYLDAANTPITNAQGAPVLGMDKPHFLGPIIIAQKDTPVRIKFTNYLPTGEAGKLFVPVDTSVLGSGGSGPDKPYFTQTRAGIHLHGGRSPWISDGTPHQWVAPRNEVDANGQPLPGNLKRGSSTYPVPDMPAPDDGSMTLYYTNQQSARLLFYHDHAWGLTRLNVYVGNAAGYVIQDQVELDLVNRNIIPAEQIPLVLEDKTFVDPDTIAQTDPTWLDPTLNFGTGTVDTNLPLMDRIRTPVKGDLWWPHIYMPVQNPIDLGGINSMGRWQYGPHFWPPTTNIAFPPVPNEYFSPDVDPPLYPEFRPDTPNPSWGAEAFMDTMTVNGTAYPTVTVKPKAYRFRVLNAAHDRFVNLQMYVADPDTLSSDGRTHTEVRMVPATAASNLPADWPADGREGGVPDPTLMGPDFIQIGTEAGFLPAPVVLKQKPVTWNTDPTTFAAGVVNGGTLILGPAERADIVVDFSQFAGKTLILYNDSPAPFPALDPHYDYYTGAPDISDTGGYTYPDPTSPNSPRVGFSPNTRTVMQIKVENVAPVTFAVQTLIDAFKTTATQDGVFKRGQDPIPVAQAAYNSAYGKTFPSPMNKYGGISRIYDSALNFKTISLKTFDQFPMKPKAIQDEMGETFDEYGRMSAKLGLELPFTNAGNQTFVLQAFIDPPTEILLDCLQAGEPQQDALGKPSDGTQIWKITHNGVDTHPLHFHLFDVQIINRVAWDNAVYLPDPNELGWKETVRVSPLMDTIVALRPISPKLPFGIPNSVRPLNPAAPIGDTQGFTNLDPLTGQPLPTPTVNELYSFGWEYVFHCHILSHEEMDMMRPMAFQVATTKPAAPVLSGLRVTGGVDLAWTDATRPNMPSTLGNPANEVGFRIERAPVNPGGVVGAYAEIGKALANAITYRDTTAVATQRYRYRVVAFNAAGESTSNSLLIDLVPAAPTRLSVTVRHRTDVTLVWNDNSNNETGFYLERRLGNTGAFARLPATLPTNSVTYRDLGLTPNTAYQYRVQAYNAAGVSAYSNVLSVTTRP